MPQEVRGVSREGASTVFVDSQFTPDVMLRRVADPVYSRVHVATHAEFRPGSIGDSYVYTGTAPVPFRDFLAIRQRRASQPIDLFVLSACRTALGDSSSELGFAGLAIQAGAKSAVGTLWYVDDVATSAYFLQMYRYMDQGLPKAEALQATRVSFAKGLIRLDGSKVLGADGVPLLLGLTSQQQRRVASGLAHPFFWSGIELIGTPW